MYDEIISRIFRSSVPRLARGLGRQASPANRSFWPIVCVRGWIVLIGCLALGGNVTAQEQTTSKNSAARVGSQTKSSETATTIGADPAAVIVSKTGSNPEQPPAPPKFDPNKVYELTFDDLAFEMEKGTNFSRELLTKKIKSYDGATIKLRGFIKPAFTQTGLTKFIFVRDNQECCFGPTAALYDNMLVKLADGVKVDYTVRPVTVAGKFYLKEYQGPDGKVWSIYRMKDGRVK